QGARTCTLRWAEYGWLGSNQDRIRVSLGLSFRSRRCSAMAMARWYEVDRVQLLRKEVEADLELTARPRHESPKEFWARVEREGQLVKALALYDQLLAQKLAWQRVGRETKKAFAERVEREGRQAEAERVRAELMTSGLAQRKVQEELVKRFPPLDGSQTRF